MPRLLIVGNSVSLTRPGAVGYPDLIERRLGGAWEIRRLVESAMTVEDHEAAALEALRAFRPDVLILQVGVVECAPRPISRRERALLGRVRPGRLQTRIIRFLHDHRARIIRLRGLNQWTPPARFAASVKRIVVAARASGARVLILPITRVTAYAELRQPNFNREIARYNAILRESCGEGVAFIEEADVMSGLVPEEFSITEDSVHLNAVGQERMAEHIVRMVEVVAGESPLRVAGPRPKGSG